MRKLGFVGATVIATVVLTASSAFAFECYNANRSAQGNAAAAGANGFFTIEDALINFEGLCPAGAQVVIDGLAAAGFETDLLINAHALMAGGLEKSDKGEELLADGQGIDHLSDEFFETVGSLIPAGHAACA